MKLDFANVLRVLAGVIIATVLHGCNDTANSTSGAEAKITVTIPHASSNRAARTTTDAVIAPAYIQTYAITVRDSANNVIVTSREIPARGGELSLTVPSNTALQVTGEALDQGHNVRFRGSKAMSPIAAGASPTVSITLDALTPLSATVQATAQGILTVPDNTTDVVLITTNANKADQDVTFDVTGGADRKFFIVDHNSGQLSFNNPPSSSNPLDENKDNVYEVQVTFTDGFESVPQDLKVTVGNIDISFGTNGIVRTDFGTDTAVSYDSAKAVIVQLDGKIVVAGTINSESNSALIRYNSNGTIDDKFGTQGIAKFSLDGAVRIHAMALQPDGMILVAGSVFFGATDDFLLARFNTDGAPDTSFGSNGIVTTDFATLFESSTMENERAFALALQSDGKIVVAGEVGVIGGAGTHFAVARYDSNGKLDPGFGPNINGVVMSNLGSTSDTASALTLQAGGKIVVAGSASFTDTHDDFAIVRYTSDGMLDSTFGTNGLVITDFAKYNDRVTGVVIQPDGTPEGKIVATGSGGFIDIDGRVHNGIVLARYTNSGLLDESFGVKGKAFVEFSGNGSVSYYAYAAALQTDGKIVLAGQYDDCNDGCVRFVLARFNINGLVDTSFGGNGKVVTDFNSTANAIALQPDGKIIAAGSLRGVTADDFAVVRFYP